MNDREELSCLPVNRELRAKASKVLDAEREQLADKKNREYWQAKSNLNYTNDPRFLETFDPVKRDPYRAVAAYVTHLVELYILAKSSVLAYGKMRPYALDQLPRWWCRYKEGPIGLFEGAQHGGTPTFHDVPAQEYVDIRPKNVYTDKMLLPVDAIELGNLLTTSALEELITDARNELEIKRALDVWNLLNASATAAFGATLVRQVHPSVAVGRLIAGNDFNWTTGQVNPGGGVFAAGFTLPKMQELVNLTSGMLGRDGRPLGIRRIIVPNGAQVRRDVMAWPGPTAAGAGMPEGIKEDIWRGTWLFQPRNLETGELLVNAIMEEDATIGDHYIYVFTNEPAFEFAYWPDAYKEFQRDVTFEDPDHVGFFIRDKYKEYEPSPYLWHWLRIRIW